MTIKEKSDVKLLEENLTQQLEIKVYKRRWIILSIFILYAAVNAYQWIEYSSITSIIVKYYQVSSLAVDWTSIIYMALYPILVIPASYIIDKKGLRAAGLIGCLGTALGTSIKLVSIGRDSFYVVLIGQAIVSASQLLILCLPPKIASVWFKPNEVSTACSLGVFGTQLGAALAYVATPLMVRNHESMEAIGTDLRILCWTLTIVIIPVTIAVIFYFPEKPPLPPNITQAQERGRNLEFKASEFFHSIKLLFLNKGFNIHMAAYGINIGVFSALGTFLSQFILMYFENAHEDAGRMGFVMIVVGMIGSIGFGIFLDKTRKYKETAIFVYLMSSLSVFAFMFSLELKSKLLVYISCGLVGLFTNAYMPVGFELAMELTFPSQESTTTGILLAVTQILGVLFAVALGYLNIWIGPFWALSTQAILLTIGTIITAFVPNDLRRQAAFNGHLNNEPQKFAAIPTEEKL